MGGYTNVTNAGAYGLVYGMEYATHNVKGHPSHTEDGND